MIESCPLCGCKEATDFLRCPDNFTSDEFFTIRRCNECRFLFTADEPGLEKIGAYYASDDYEPLKGKQSKLRAYLRKFRLWRMAFFIEQHRRKKVGSILDIGCGTGDFLELMKKRGWNVSGIEPDEACRTTLIEKGINVIAPHDIAIIPDVSADVITLFHVLEHVHGLAAFGREVRRILKPEGICIIAVPNADAYYAAVYANHWSAYDVPRHLYHFTTKSLTTFVLQSGMKIIRLSSMPLDSLYSCIMSEQNMKGSILRGLMRAIISITVSAQHPSSSSTILAVVKADTLAKESPNLGI